MATAENADHPHATAPLDRTVDTARDRQQISRDAATAQPLWRRRFVFDRDRRDSPSEVVSGRLWMGGFLDAHTLDTVCAGVDDPLLSDVGILQLAKTPTADGADERCWAEDARVRTLRVALMDDSLEQTVDPAALASEIDGLLAEHARVYVHCAMGVSRSSTAVLAWLMQVRGMSYPESLCFLQLRRPCVCPNAAFTAALQAFDCTQLRALSTDV
jgi:hypothetical protein